MSAKASSLLKNTVALSVCTLLSKGLVFVMIPMFTRWISVEEYGYFDVLSTYAILLVPIISLASSNAVFRLSVTSETGLQKDYISNGLIIIVLNLTIAVIIITTINWIRPIANFESFICYLAAEILDNYCQGYLRAIKKIRVLGISKAISAVMTILSVTALVKLFSMSVDGLIIGYALGLTVGVMVAAIQTEYWSYFSLSRFSSQRIREILSYSWPLVPNDISWWVINVSDRQIINMILGTAYNGIYAVSNKVPGLCSAVFGVFNISWQESATEYVSRENREDYYKDIYSSVLCTLLSICIMIISCNFIIFDYVFDPRYSNSRQYSAILVVSVIFSTMALFYGGIQIGLKRPKENGISTILGALINLVVHLSLIKPMGLYAAAVSTMVSNISVVEIRRFQLRNECKFLPDKKHISLFIIYCYYSVVSVIRLPLLINSIHLIVAFGLFAFMNTKKIKALLRIG